MKLLRIRTPNTCSVNLTKKVKKLEKALGKHVINLYSTGISQWLKIKHVKKLRQDIKNEPIRSDGEFRLSFCVYVW